MITYEVSRKTQLYEVNVKLDGKIAGTIKRQTTGWQYYPKGSKEGGEIFLTLSECKRSLEATERESGIELICKEDDLLQ